MFVRKLVISNFLSRKVRAALTIAAVALSVSLVVAVTTGYESVRATARKFMDQYLGAVDAQVTRQNDPRGPVTERVVDALNADDDWVRRATGRIEMESTVIDHRNQPVEGRFVTLFGVRPRGDPVGDPRIEQLRLVHGQFFDKIDANVAVVDQALAAKLLRERRDVASPRDPPPGQSALPVGEREEEEEREPDVSPIIGKTVTLPKGDQRLTLQIIGVIRKPEVFASQMQTMYVPLRTLQRFEGWDSGADGLRVNRVDIELQRGVDPREFEAAWAPRVKQIDPNLKLKLTRDIRSQLDDQMKGLDLLSHLGGAVSMLAATFIVFSALTMGVGERQRTLAMLRAVGAFRLQIGALVVVEGLLLAGCGALIGVPLGWLWVKILTLMFPDLFAAGVAIHWLGVASGSIGSIATALAASILPAWWATRVSPLEAMAPESSPTAGRPSMWLPLVGLLLIAIDPFLLYGLEPVAGWFGVENARDATLPTAFLLHFVLGLPALFIGFFLLAPVFVKFIELVVAPVVAAMLGLRYALLRQQLSTGLWRAAGTCAALMVGLAVLVVMQVQGRSAMQGWRLPTHFPDVFIVSPPGANIIGSKKTGIAFEQMRDIAKVPGIRNGEIMPIAIASPQFGHGMTSVALTLMNPDATMFFGIDPRLAFKMMDLEFRDGTSAEAEEILADGKGLVLKPDQTVLAENEWKPDRRRKRVPAIKGAVLDAKNRVVLHGLITGETAEAYQIQLTGGKPRTVPKAQVLEVARGRFLVVTNEFKELKGLGVGDPFPLKSNDGTMAYFTIAGVVWSPGIDVIVSVYDMGRQFDQRTAASVFGTLETARDDFGVERIYLYAANLDWGIQKEDLLKSIKRELRAEGFTVGDVREIKSKIVQAFDRILLLASTVAFAAMAVASLGVTNTVMAGIRTRRWQFGVLRSIGVTRGQLLRVVLCEAMLLGVVAIVLGLLAGGVMVADAHKLQVLLIGYNPDIAIPWGIVGIGMGVVLLIAVGASVWPAINVARTEPLSLLQAGRAAT